MTARQYSILPLLVVLCAILPACVNVKEVSKSGKAVTVLHVSGKVGRIDFTSANGTHVIIDNFDPTSVHKAIGANFANGAVATGTAIASSGLTKFIKP